MEIVGCWSCMGYCTLTLCKTLGAYVCFKCRKAAAAADRCDSCKEYIEQQRGVKRDERDEDLP